MNISKGEPSVKPAPEVVVDLGDRRYPIYIGGGLLAAGSVLASHVAGRQVLIVSDTGVAPHYLDLVQAALADFDHEALVVPAGEESKDLSVLARVFDRLMERRFNRRATIVALGGGVVGDLAGFAAACYQRGINFIQVPTTLLAQVDSSVGGKTAVNHPLGKNMIGAFYQPIAVIADLDTLTTLSARELSAGLAEVIKYGVLWDGDFFDWLDQNLDALLSRDTDALKYAVRRSCEIKAEIVIADEREANLRALLNLGHTYGHAIETGLGYGSWLHGEAVAAGICMAADTARRMGWLSTEDAERIERIIARADLPTGAPGQMSPAQIRELMTVDKKAIDGGIRLVLPTAVGKTTLTSEYSEEALMATLAECRA